MKPIRTVFAVLAIALASLPAAQAQDPLSSWNDGQTKQAITKFVAGAIDKNGPNFMAPEERIATFDNDGTLWCEQPVVELAFTEGKVKEISANDPTLKGRKLVIIGGCFDFRIQSDGVFPLDVMPEAQGALR